MEKTILLIDDSTTNSKAVQIFLTGTGYKFVSQPSGEAGLSYLLENKVDLIFLDIEMPLLDGYDVCLLIKNNELFKNIPLIMVSSKDSDLDAYKGFTYGADDYVSKPYKKEMLLEKIKKYIGDNE